jgi:hypothetical protein
MRALSTARSIVSVAGGAACCAQSEQGNAKTMMVRIIITDELGRWISCIEESMLTFSIGDRNRSSISTPDNSDVTVRVASDDVKVASESTV